MLRFSAIMFFVCLTILGPVCALSATLNIPSEFPTIQAGIIAAAPGDSVVLESGIYFGEGNRDIDFMGKDITVRSHDSNPSTCTIFCQGTTADPHRGFVFHSGESPQALLEGVTIKAGRIFGNGEYFFGGGAILCIDGSSPTIKNCRMTQCEVLHDGGAFASSYSSPTLIDCKIDNNRGLFGAGAIAVTGDDSFVMSGCLVVDNHSDSGYDGLVLTCPSSLIYQCTFANHHDVSIYSEVPVTLSNCTIVNNGIGISSYANITMENTLVAFNGMVFYDNGVDEHVMNCNNIFGNDDGNYVFPIANHENINGNISREPFLCDPDNWDYHVAPDSPCLDGLCGQIGAFGAGDCALVSAVEETPEVSFGLRGNHPNPFNPSTVISYYLERDSSVKLQVYDISGKLVRTLADESSVVAGQHDVTWNGFDDRGQRVAAGVFLYVLTTPSGRDVGRMALIK